MRLYNCCPEYACSDSRGTTLELWDFDDKMDLDIVGMHPEVSSPYRMSYSVMRGDAAKA